jgi:hypothetical protein
MAKQKQAISPAPSGAGADAQNNAAGDAPDTSLAGAEEGAASPESVIDMTHPWFTNTDFPVTTVLRNDGERPHVEPVTGAFLAQGGSHQVTLHDASFAAGVLENLAHINAGYEDGRKAVYFDGAPDDLILTKGD